MAPLSAWPWENLGIFKYMLLGPLVGKVVYSRLQADFVDLASDWCFQLLLVTIVRFHIYTWYTNFCNMLFLTRTRRIISKGVDFDQIDREWDWDNFIILQALIATLCVYMFPVANLPVWETKGLLAIVVIHVLVSEPLYYWVHRFFLHGNYLFTPYHSFHHSSTVPQPVTAESTTFLEALLVTTVIGLPILGCSLSGYGSRSVIYGYVLVFDFLRCFGYSNVEIMPHWIYESFPLLKFILYTPTYYSLHHSEMKTNYCLFMPLYDAMWNTLDANSWVLHKKISLDAGGKSTRVPDFVFLAHVVDITASLHAPFVTRSFASMPYSARLFLLPEWPGAILAMLVMWAKSKTFLSSFYSLRGKLHQTWIVPRFGFQYFLPFASKGINKHIEEAILRADRLGVKVISLAALNKNEALNGGGTLFVKKHPNLKVRVVHGNTLTAAVILNEIHEHVKEVFLTGATSKLGRAIALYLCRRGVRVLMLTLSTDRFQNIQEEAPADCQKNLVQVTKYQAAKNCKTWVVGKWITPTQQRWAPPGTHFHQFVVPPIFAFRRDCTYGDLAAMKLPDDVEGLGSCEYTMGRGIVHACHAGGVVHSLEGWSHHEVGALDVDRIDIVWKAALKHGFQPVSSIPN